MNEFIQSSLVSAASPTKPREMLLECELLLVYAIICTNENGVTHTMKQDKDIVDRIAGECLLGRARLLDRVLMGIYDHELRPFGLKATQLTLLVVVAKVGPVRRIEIGKRLHLDPSTLTRNLKIMLTNGWIQEIVDGEDGRGLPVQITVQGRALLNQIGPSWRKAQTRTEKFLGDEGATLLRKLAANRIELPSG
jgi:DNA-binding MarR family transcriptional regulator